MTMLFLLGVLCGLAAVVLAGAALGRASQPSPSPSPSPSLLRRLAALGGRPLVGLAAGSLVLLGFSLLMQVLDPRLLQGVSLWVKPAKFAASIALTSLTLALLLPHIGLSARARRRVVAVIVGFAVLELVIITVQAARGVVSHFNAATRMDAALFVTMGIGIVIFTLGIAYVAVAAFRQRFQDRALGWGIRLGFVAMLFGSSIAFLMPRPTPAQLASLRAGQATPLVGAHAVGVPDGGPGLPVTGWSSRGGDLRVPHFIGLHGLQLLPLVGWLLGRRRRDARPSVLAVPLTPLAVPLTVIAGAVYVGLTATTLVEALRARPLFAPDTVTVLVGATVLAAGIVAVIAIVARQALREGRSARRRGEGAAREGRVLDCSGPSQGGQTVVYGPPHRDTPPVAHA